MGDRVAATLHTCERDVARDKQKKYAPAPSERADRRGRLETSSSCKSQVAG